MLFQYSAKNTIITISPQITLGIPEYVVTGYAENDFASLTLSEDDWATTAGADGLVVRSFHPNPISTMTLTLQQTSPANTFLSYLRNIDKQVIGSGVFAIKIQTPAAAAGLNQNGFGTGNTMSCSTAYVSKMADLGYAKDSGDRAWSITLVNAVFEGNIASIMASGIASIARDVTTMTKSII